MTMRVWLSVQGGRGYWTVNLTGTQSFMLTFFHSLALNLVTFIKSRFFCLKNNSCNLQNGYLILFGNIGDVLQFIIHCLIPSDPCFLYFYPCIFYPWLSILSIYLSLLLNYGQASKLTTEAVCFEKYFLKLNDPGLGLI